MEHSEPTPKKGKLENDKRTKGTGTTGSGAVIKGPSRRRKSVDKNESARRAGKKAESESEDELDDNNTHLKRKRGWPKGSGRKDSGVSGDEMAGLSSDTTPTVAAKKGKPVSSEPRSMFESAKKRGRPAKPKAEEEKSSLKKKVHFPF